MLRRDAGPRRAPVEMRRADDVPTCRWNCSPSWARARSSSTGSRTATHFVLVTIQSQPGWPPMHEWMARAMATVLADRLGSDVVDVLNYHVLEPVRAAATLPDAAGRIRLADWVWIDYSADSTGYWCTTTGLRRFGLPELQTLATPPHVVEAWGQAMTGIAHRLLGAWSAALADDRSMAFVQLPSTVEVSAPGHRHGVRPRRRAGRCARRPGRGAARPRPGLRSGGPLVPDHPPAAGAGPARPASTSPRPAPRCSAPGTSDVARPSRAPRWTRRSSMARAGLDEHPRPVRVRRSWSCASSSWSSTPCRPTEGTEYVWAYVTSWRDPDRILAASAADAIYQPEGAGGPPGGRRHAPPLWTGPSSTTTAASSKAAGPRPPSTNPDRRRLPVTSQRRPQRTRPQRTRGGDEGGRDHAHAGAAAADVDLDLVAGGDAGGGVEQGQADADAAWWARTCRW